MLIMLIMYIAIFNMLIMYIVADNMATMYVSYSPVSFQNFMFAFAA